MTTSPSVLIHRLHPGDHRFAERGEVGTAVIDRWRIDRAQHAVGDVGRPRDLQEMAAGGGVVYGFIAMAPRKPDDGACAASMGTRWAGEPMLRTLAGEAASSTIARPMTSRPTARLAAVAVAGEVLFDAASRGTLRDRRVDLRSRAARRARAEVAGRRAGGDRPLPRGEGAAAAARRRQLAVRADGRRRARHRSQQAPIGHHARSTATR